MQSLSRPLIVEQPLIRSTMNTPHSEVMAPVSDQHQRQKAPRHVGIIMDGNGRWATQRGAPRSVGHRAGVTALRRVVDAAPSRGITTLTVFAFSSENWSRPPAEVATLMDLLGAFLKSDRKRMCDGDVRLTMIGRRDRLAPHLVSAIEDAEAATATNSKLHLRVAIDYCGRTEMHDRALKSATEIDAVPDADLIIRPGGEVRLSNFLLWDAAYAELYFTPTLWPDFDTAALDQALATFSARDRRFGGLTAATP